MLRSGTAASAALPGVVARASLLERLSAADGQAVTQISAPAGSGNTVLLRSWIAAVGHAPGAATDEPGVPLAACDLSLCPRDTRRGLRAPVSSAVVTGEPTDDSPPPGDDAAREPELGGTTLRVFGATETDRSLDIIAVWPSGEGAQ